MKSLLFAALLFSGAAHAADLPTITVEHMYYLQARAEHVRFLSEENKIDYCLAQKLGGPAFENLYGQIFSLKVDIAKHVKVQKTETEDVRVVTFAKTIEAYNALLREEAKRIQKGIVTEGKVATETMNAIARAQNSR